MIKFKCTITYSPEIYNEGPTPEIERCNLCESAPELLEALKLAINALNRVPNFTLNDTTSYKILSLCDKAVAKAERGAS